jgi:hypothetical protein
LLPKMRRVLNEKDKRSNYKTETCFICFSFRIFACIAGNPYENTTASVNTKELAIIIEKQNDHITVDELLTGLSKRNQITGWLILMKQQKYEEYHIPSAENIALPDLNKADILRNEKIIFIPMEVFIQHRHGC